MSTIGENGKSRISNLLQAIPRIQGQLEVKKHLDLVRPDLNRVDQAIRQQADKFDPGISGYIEYATETSGKRIRPGLAVLSAHASGDLKPAHIDLAVIVELIHLASLIHDDILDNALVRRTRPTVFAKWGAELSVLLGDSLFAHSLQLCLQFDDRSVSRAVAEATNEVCAGEILQTQRRFDLKLSLPEYTRIIRMKTAALFRVSCEQATVLNGSPSSTVEAMRNYGESLGIAYQIYDDCLDLFGTEDAFGKTLGTDLTKGKLTLPVLHILSHLKENDMEDVSEIILHGDEEQRLTLTKRVFDEGGVSYSIRKAREYCDRAYRALDILPDSDHRTALQFIPRALNDHLNTLKA